MTRYLVTLCDTDYWATSLQTSYIVLFSTGTIFVDFYIYLSIVCCLLFTFSFGGLETTGGSRFSPPLRGSYPRLQIGLQARACCTASLTDRCLAFYLVYVWCGEERTTGEFWFQGTLVPVLARDLTSDLCPGLVCSFLPLMVDV